MYIIRGFSYDSYSYVYSKPPKRISAYRFEYGTEFTKNFVSIKSYAMQFVALLIGIYLSKKINKFVIICYYVDLFVYEME